MNPRSPQTRIWEPLVLLYYYKKRNALSSNASFPRMHSTARHLCQLSSCDFPCCSDLSSSKMVDRCINLAQSPTKKRHCQTARVEVSKEEKEPFFQAMHLHEGKRPRAHVARGRSHVGRERFPLEPGRSPAPQRGACWEGDVGHRPQLGVCCAAQHYRSPLSRRRDVPLTLMVKTGGMCVSLPAGAAVNTCRLAATKTQQPDEVSTALGEKIRSMLSFTLEYFKSAIRILTRFFLPWVSLSMPLPMKSRSHSI